MTDARVLILAGSTRKGSFNGKLGEQAAVELESRGIQITRLSLLDYQMPIYNFEIEEEEGVPKIVQSLHHEFQSHQGIFMASPEYNANISPLLLNAIAWLSRMTGNEGVKAAFGKPVFAIGSASPGDFGGYRGLMVLRNVLELQLGARVIPSMVSISKAHEAFDNNGKLQSPHSQKMLNMVLSELIVAMHQCSRKD